VVPLRGALTCTPRHGQRSYPGHTCPGCRCRTRRRPEQIGTSFTWCGSDRTGSGHTRLRGSVRLRKSFRVASRFGRIQLDFRSLIQNLSCLCTCVDWRRAPSASHRLSRRLRLLTSELFIFLEIGFCLTAVLYFKQENISIISKGERNGCQSARSGRY
jgi:hypothetical protein